ncbi:MAG: hypothetical protein RTU63_14590 [Candidatus Thorarchaeota archaeon]
MTLDLKAKYIKAASDLSNAEVSNDVATLIHRTPWVRILLEYDKEESESFFLEVEISFPEGAGSKDVDYSELIDNLSEHLQYLQKLRYAGFQLSVISTGCIYCASKELQETPEDNLFSALIPPDTG